MREIQTMDPLIQKLLQKNIEKTKEKSTKYKSEIFNSQQFQQELKYISNITFDFIEAIRQISIYSTRSKEIYQQLLTIRASDDIIQSAMGIRFLTMDGLQNMAKRELRYLIEMSTKYLVIDQEMMGKTIKEKTHYLRTRIPNSSIDVTERLLTYFDSELDKQFKDEIRDFYYKACAYVHPSQKQIEEQLRNYDNGFMLGFESAKSLQNTNKIVFRAYDIILVLLLTGFGHSMAGDLFINNFDNNRKWKFHRGKYINHFSKLFDYKHERQ